MEQELFQWEQWDGNQSCMTYYSVMLKVPIGMFPAGTKFISASIEYEKGLLQLWNDKIVGQYKLKLEVGEDVPWEEE